LSVVFKSNIQYVAFFVIKQLHSFLSEILKFLTRRERFTSSRN
jgi:hypothetical protein